MAKLHAALAVASGLVLFGAVGQANATVLFMVDPSPSQFEMLKLSHEHGMTTDPAQVDGAPVAITVQYEFRFRERLFMTIKPATGNLRPPSSRRRMTSSSMTFPSEVRISSPTRSSR